MKKNRILWFGIITLSMIASLFFVVGCATSDDDDESTTSTTASSNSLDFANSAARALPAIEGSSSSSAPSLTAGDVISDQVISNFFKLECYMPDSDNNCPTGVTPEINTNKYTVTTLIGVIYHAEMYMENVLNYFASSCTAATVNASSFKTDDSSGDTSTYLIDYFSQLNCIGSSTYSSQTQYFATQTDTSAKNVMIVTRKHDTATAGWDQSDIYQAYLSKTDASNDHVLAFNTTNINDTAADDSTFRTVLIVNLSNRKFLVRFHGTGSNYVMAAGQGGISTAGVFESGYYFAKSNATPSGICINNATRLEADAANCSAETATWTSAADVATYLDLTAAEQTDLANFLLYFTDGPTTTALSVFPATATDAMHIPDRIE
ncbi:hypothetical protein KJ966_11860 [bacterium]|nr:hypothetical protein [bacterium]